MQADFSQYTIPLITFALLVCMVIVFSLSRKLQQSIQDLKHKDQLILTMRRDIAALCSGAVGIGKRLVKIEYGLRHQEERQDQLELREPAQQPFEHAVRLVQQGSDLKELMSTCALTQGEAELIMMLHRYDNFDGKILPRDNNMAQHV
ncbi:MAG: hypothetical protein BMS9Abin26_1227 [Gammaproteobacteria bacterium]|nr:MAG: hypothetical protein BMS9Abin26_1227 [Gammaproteobacteria bacterium]